MTPSRPFCKPSRACASMPPRYAYTATRNMNRNPVSRPCMRHGFKSPKLLGINICMFFEHLRVLRGGGRGGRGALGGDTGQNMGCSRDSLAGEA